MDRLGFSIVNNPFLDGSQPLLLNESCICLYIPPPIALTLGL